MIRMAEPISAGFPSAAEGYEDEPLDLHTWLVRNPAATFFYRVEGDVLRDEYIRHGAILVVDRSITPLRGRLAVSEEQGQFTITRFKGDSSLIVGVVVGVVTRF
jgi:DNA polymerase V